MSRIWLCFINVIGHCSAILMFCIFILVCHQQVAIVLKCFFYHVGGFWFGRCVVFDSFVTIRCSMYCDIIVLILSWWYTFLILYLYILFHSDICPDMACMLCISLLFGDKFIIQWVCWTIFAFDECIKNALFIYLFIELSITMEFKKRSEARKLASYWQLNVTKDDRPLRLCIHLVLSLRITNKVPISNIVCLCVCKNAADFF